MKILNICLFTFLVKMSNAVPVQPGLLDAYNAYGPPVPPPQSRVETIQAISTVAANVIIPSSVPSKNQDVYVAPLPTQIAKSTVQKKRKRRCKRRRHVPTPTPTSHAKANVVPTQPPCDEPHEKVTSLAKGVVVTTKAQPKEDDCDEPNLLLMQRGMLYRLKSVMKLHRRVTQSMSLYLPSHVKRICRHLLHMQRMWL